jgi:hypothetical protein
MHIFAESTGSIIKPHSLAAARQSPADFAYRGASGTISGTLNSSVFGTPLWEHLAD